MSVNNVPSRTEVLNFIKFSQGSQFVIPVYQRNYTWDPKVETTKLIEDFDSLLSDANKSGHFLGILMYLPTHFDATFNQFNIIDGQQRLTTIFLCLIALRKLSEESGTNSKDMIDDFYLFNKYATDDKKFRMKPLVSDDFVFQKLLNNKYHEISESEKNTLIFKNYSFLYDYFSDAKTKYSIDEIHNALLKFNIVSIPLISSDDPQQIFESINSTGAPLTSADLIRNYVLMNYNDKTQEELYLNHWKKLEDLQPESKKLEEVIRHFIALKTYDLPNKKDIYSDFKRWWVNEDLSPASKIDELCKFVNYYNLIYVSNTDSLPELLREKILDFRNTSSQMPASFLMKTLDLYLSNKIGSEQTNSLFSLINTYLIRRWITDLNTSSISRFFPQLLRNVAQECNEDYSNIVDITAYFLIDETSSNKSYMPSDAQIRNYLSNNNAYSIKVIRTILEGIENHNNTAPVVFSKLNIEHIMPQRPNDYWREVTQINDLEYIHQCNLLGNLTLCSSYDNSKMGNSEFSKKKNVLKETSHLKLNEEILMHDTWTIEKINERTHKLITSILEIYPTYHSNYASLPKEELEISLITKSVNANALFLSEDKVIVLRGSTFAPYTRRNNNGSYFDLLEELIEEEVLVKENGNLYFQKDYEFSSLSYSAGFLISGSSINGWDRWKLSNGNSIGSIRDQILER